MDEHGSPCSDGQTLYKHHAPDAIPQALAPPCIANQAGGIGGSMGHLFELSVCLPIPPCVATMGGASHEGTQM